MRFRWQGDSDLFLLLSNIPCTCGFYIMKSEYNFSTISKAIETGVYVRLYWRKSLGCLFSFVFFIEYFMLPNRIWLCASTKTFAALFNSKQINLKKNPPDKSSFLKKTQNWNNNYIYCTRLFSSKTKLMYKCINAMMNKYWVTFEAYPKISFQNVKMNLKRKPQVIN